MVFIRLHREYRAFYLLRTYFLSEKFTIRSILDYIGYTLVGRPVFWLRVVANLLNYPHSLAFHNSFYLTLHIFPYSSLILTLTICFTQIALNNSHTHSFTHNHSPSKSIPFTHFHMNSIKSLLRHFLIFLHTYENWKI